MLRRTLLVSGAAAALRAAPPRPRQILFTGRGASGFLNPGRRLEIIQEDGRQLRILPVPGGNESGWGAYGFFRDGRALLQSLALPAGWQKQTFDEYYHRSRTRLWAYRLPSGPAREICQRDRVSAFYSACCLLPGETRVAVTAMIGGKSVLYTVNLDGTDPRPVTRPDEFVYGVSLSPDGQRFAFHANYRIHVCRVDGSERRELAAEPGLLHFGTSWSPDGRFVLFQVCDPKQDPGHDWSSVVIVRADGSHPAQVLTPPASAWFGASYGPPDNPGGGSNQPQWAPSGAGVLYVRRIPGAGTAWEFQTGSRDTDHFNREYRPDAARGGTHLALIDPVTGRETFLTPHIEGQWDFRAAWSPDSRRICFLRARTGANPELWVMDADGAQARPLTRGVRVAGAEHPVWVP